MEEQTDLTCDCVVVSGRLQTAYSVAATDSVPHRQPVATTSSHYSRHQNRCSVGDLLHCRAKMMMIRSDDDDVDDDDSDYSNRDDDDGMTCDSTLSTALCFAIKAIY